MKPQGKKQFPILNRKQKPTQSSNAGGQQTPSKPGKSNVELPAGVFEVQLPKEDNWQMSSQKRSITSSIMNMKLSTGRQSSIVPKQPHQEKSYGAGSKKKHTYTKLKSCLHTALFCVQATKKIEEIRLFGTTSVQYNLLFKSKEFVKEKLKPTNLVQKVEFNIPWYMFNPNGKFILGWNLIGLVFTLYAVTFMPYAMVFSESKGIELFENIMNFFFLADVLVNLLTAICKSDEE